MPIMRHWDVFDRTFGEVGERARSELAALLEGLDAQATRFVERRAENRARGRPVRQRRDTRHRLLSLLTGDARLLGAPVSWGR